MHSCASVLVHVILATVTQTADTVLRSELEKRDGQIKDLTGKYTEESQLRAKVVEERDQLAHRLVGTTEHVQFT